MTAARAAGMTVLGLTAGSHCLDGQADRLWQAGAARVFASCADLARHLQAPASG